MPMKPLYVEITAEQKAWLDGLGTKKTVFIRAVLDYMIARPGVTNQVVDWASDENP